MHSLSMLVNGQTMMGTVSETMLTLMTIMTESMILRMISHQIRTKILILMVMVSVTMLMMMMTAILTAILLRMIVAQTLFLLAVFQLIQIAMGLVTHWIPMMMEMVLMIPMMTSRQILTKIQIPMEMEPAIMQIWMMMEMAQMMHTMISLQTLTRILIQMEMVLATTQILTMMMTDTQIRPNSLVALILWTHQAFRSILMAMGHVMLQMQMMMEME